MFVGFKLYYFYNMRLRRHWAIFSSDLTMRSTFIQDLLKGEPCGELHLLTGMKGALFSNYTLEQFIREESLHDDYTLSIQEHRSIRTFSSGEQRKALLNHLLSTRPDFLILDNVFDMLDVESRQKLDIKLQEIARHITILQVIKRKDNLLPFLNRAILIEKEKVLFSGKIEEYLETHSEPDTFTFKGELPPPLKSNKTFSAPLVQFDDVSVKYGERTIVKKINWIINHGDFWQLKGPNGSGKTTLLTMITGDNPKAYGQNLVLFGKKRGSGESIWDIKKQIGYITPSMITLFRGWNTVEKMVVSGLVDSIGLYTKPTDAQRGLAGQWIKLLGFEQLKHSRFSNLNEVQKRMVLIARSMIKHPLLLILDEPAYGLDDHNAEILTSLVNKIAREGGTTIIYVSHRDEPGLAPRQVYELIPGPEGSSGIAR